MINKDSKIVRFKMRVIDNDRTEPTLARIVLNGVFDTIPEDLEGKFVAGEPQGPLRFQIRKQDVADLFVQGQDYYLDFAPTFQEEGSNEEQDMDADSVEKRTQTWTDENADNGTSRSVI